jgi:hypothetical protein
MFQSSFEIPAVREDDESGEIEVAQAPAASEVLESKPVDTPWISVYAMQVPEPLNAFQEVREKVLSLVKSVPDVPAPIVDPKPVKKEATGYQGTVPTVTFETVLDRIQNLQLEKRDLLDQLKPRGKFGFFKKVANLFNAHKTAQKNAQLAEVEAQLKEATAQLESLQSRRAQQEASSFNAKASFAPRLAA